MGVGRSNATVNTGESLFTNSAAAGADRVDTPDMPDIATRDTNTHRERLSRSHKALALFYRARLYRDTRKTS